MTDLQLLGLAAVIAVGGGHAAWRWMNRRAEHGWCHTCQRWVGDAEDLALHRRLAHLPRPVGPEDRGDWS